MFPGRRFSFSVIAICVALTAIVSNAAAEEFTWTGGGDGSTWNQADNWSPSNGGNFPSFGDDARFQTDATVDGGDADTIEVAPGVTLRLRTDSQTVIDQWINNQGVMTFEYDDNSTLSGGDTTYQSFRSPVLGQPVSI